MNPYAYDSQSIVNPPEPSPPKRGYLFRFIEKAWPLAAGVVAGIALRLIFSGAPEEPYAPMMASFILLSPLLVGAVTVYVAERQVRRSWGYYFLFPFIANVLYVVGTLLILIEGWICAILIVPLFAVLGGVGGLIMGAICRATNWPKQTLYSFAALPLLLGAFESRLDLPQRLDSVERRMLIQAPPAQVWRQLWEVRDIRPEEVDRAWMYRIGVPLPQAGVTRSTAVGLVRRITMGKGIRFDQVYGDWRPQRYVHWTYRFADDSFPSGALDDHVRIGGHYFDLKTTSYTLTPHGDATELAIRMQYRVSTQFNWYAEPIARWLMGDFEETVLDFYRRRAELAQRSLAAPRPHAGLAASARRD